MKSTCKNSGTFEGKKLSPEKVTYVPLAPSHSIMDTCYIKDVEDKIPDKSYKETYMYVNNSHKYMYELLLQLLWNSRHFMWSQTNI